MAEFWKLIVAGAASLAAAPAVAQPSGAEPQLVVVVPPLPTPKNVETDAGETGVIGIQFANVIADDLRSTGAFMTIGPKEQRPYSVTEAAAPTFPHWTGSGAGALVTGFVEARSDGRLTVGCYLHDIDRRRELVRRGFVVAPDEWRRAAHKCADAMYARVTDSSGYLDTRIAYVAVSGPKANQVKRLAVMDLDGSHHRYLTAGAETVVNPQFSPDGERIAYTSFTGGTPHVRILDIASEQDRPLTGTEPMSFAPRFSSDGRQIALSMLSGGNSDIYVVDAQGGFAQRLTNGPGIDTAPSFSPDGSKIIFESDRSGTQQLYVMNSDGSDQRRISFGTGSYASPVWSPDGDSIAFTHFDGRAMRIGMMSADGSEERILTDGWQDESPAWAPNSRFVAFQRTEQGSGRSTLYMVPVGGGAAKRLPAPQDGSDPSWSGVAE